MVLLLPLTYVGKTSNIVFAILQGRHSGRSPESPYLSVRASTSPAPSAAQAQTGDAPNPLFRDTLPLTHLFKILYRRASVTPLEGGALEIRGGGGAVSL